MTTNIVIDATDTALNQAPKSFDGIRVNIANDVNLLGVIDSLVPISACSKAIIRRVVIGKDHRLGKHVLFDKAAQSILLHIGRDKGSNFALALDHSDNGSFLGAASASSFAPTSEVRFVHFDLAPKAADWILLVIGQHGSNLLEHPPCGFVGHARLALNLFRAYPASRGSHEINGIKPSREWSRRFVKDRVGGRVNVMAAVIAGVRRARLHAMVFRDRLARIAKDAVWVQAVLEPFQTGGIVRELLLEVFQRVRQHVRLAIVVSHSDYLQPRLSAIVPTVKG